MNITQPHVFVYTIYQSLYKISKTYRVLFVFQQLFLIKERDFVCIFNKCIYDSITSDY